MGIANLGSIGGAPTLTPQNVIQQGLKSTQLDVTPFQMFLDEAVEALASVSSMEHKTNELMKKYLKGKATVDEVVHELTKLNLAMSLATTVVSNVTTTFKELQGMPI